jgi:hypothetical protein
VGQLRSPLLLLGNGSVNTSPRQLRNVGGVVFFAARVVSKESRLLVLPRPSFFIIYFYLFIAYSTTVSAAHVIQKHLILKAVVHWLPSSSEDP